MPEQTVSDNRNKTRLLVVYSRRAGEVLRPMFYSGLTYRVYAPALRDRRRGVIGAALHNARVLFWYLKIIYLLRTFNPDVVLSHGGIEARRLLGLTHRYGKKFIIRFTGNVYAEYDENMALWKTAGTEAHFKHVFYNIAHADHIITVSEDMKQQLAARSERALSDISVVTVPCDIGRFSRFKQYEQDKQIILTVSNLKFKAKTDGLIKCLPAVINVLREMPNTRYILAAQGRHLDSVRKYLAGFPELSNRIEITYTPEIQRLYRKASVLAYGSDLDGCPNAVLEAWATGTPVIVNDSAWARELVTGLSGYVCTDNETMVDAIKEVLTSSSIANLIAGIGYANLMISHTYKAVGERFAEVINAVAYGTGNSPRVLAVLAHRPEKLAAILPFTGCDYKIIHRKNRWKNLNSLARFILVLPTTLWSLMPFSRFRFNAAVKSYHPDIVISHGGIFGYPSRVVAKQTGKKFVMRLGGHVFDEMRENLKNGGIRNPVYRNHYSFVLNNLKQADRVIVVTDDMKSKLIKESNLNPSNVSVVPVPCDIKRFGKPRTLLEGKAILTVINLNFLSKVEAMKRFVPGVLAVLKNNAGCWYEIVAPGRYHKQFRNWLYKSYPCLAGRVVIHDFVKDIETYYQRADVLAYFSDLDGCPNVILEAWAARVPVIANRCSWSDGLIQDGQTGYLVDDWEQAFRQLNKVLYVSGVTEALTANAYEYVTTHHTLEIAGKRLGEVLKAL